MLVARTSVSAAFVQPGHTHGEVCQPFPNSWKGQPPPTKLDGTSDGVSTDAKATTRSTSGSAGWP